MLRPSKHSHPDITVINIAFILLARLKKNRTENYDDLLAFVRKKTDSAEVLFLPSLSLLFLLGLIIYHPKGDQFEYTGAQ